jgi:S1-C subfamily serine protease
LLGISTLGPHGRVLVIPTATVERVIDPLLANGRIARGWLGLALQPVAVPDSLRGAAGQESGLMVMSCVVDGPAATGGIVAGDILLQIAGVPVTRMRRLAEQLGPDSVGRALELKLIRAGTIMSVSVAITARPKDG